MSVGQLSRKLIVAVAGLLIALPLYAGNVPSPVIPKAKTKATAEYGCVRPVDEMRQNHMKYMKHHRDDTLREGIRTTQDSIAKCINCHVTKTKQDNYPSFGSDQHFCSTCHNYAAVNIDCFQCHRDSPANPDNHFRPPMDNQAGLSPNQAHEMSAMSLDANVSGGAK